MMYSTFRCKIAGLLLVSLLMLATAIVFLFSSAWVPAVTAAPRGQLTSTAVSGDVDRLINLPLLTHDLVNHLKLVYDNGIAQGNDPNRFILIGDSNNETPSFLQSFSYGNYGLGPHTYLQPLIDAYNSTASFAADYPSSEHGMSMNMLMDPAFVNPEICPRAANLLDCTLQLYRPSVAIMYMGTYDTCHTPYDLYKENFRAAMQLLNARGVIVILTTYTVFMDEGCWENTPAYTAVIADMAAAYRMPLIDLPAYTHLLPDAGMEADGWHLSYPRDYHTSFAGGETVYGSTLRELLTMQMLYLIRRDVMGATPDSGVIIPGSLR